jgi:hypothetical protein
MATPSTSGPKIDIKAIANDSGVAVEAYDTYDSDEETLAAAHRFGAGLLERLAVICESQPGIKVLDAAALRRMAKGLLPA